jgi:hypothetical protein
MPLDHYVSQVHLKNFYSPSLDGLMHAIRKSDLKKFPTKAQDVCRIEDGSTNAYLKENRVIEEFLKEVEPRYNLALDKLRTRTLDEESIFSIAGFAAYVAACSPTAMRLGSGPLQATVQSTANLLDKRGEISPAPDVLGGKSMSELLAEGVVKIEIDPKYPQAMGISNALYFTSVFGNSIWDVLLNDQADSSFFTSDFPAAMEVTELNSPINRIVPLAPDLAIRIVPDIKLSRQPPELRFTKLRVAYHKLKKQEVLPLNRLIVRCAEDLVFYRDNLPWVETFVAKNKSYRIESITQTIPAGSGNFIAATHRVRAKGESLTSFNV